MTTGTGEAGDGSASSRPTTPTRSAGSSAAGVDSLWVGGHVASTNPSPEAMVWLARLVEQTERVVVGTATLLLPLYPPAIVAKQLADLDRASAGGWRSASAWAASTSRTSRAAEVPIGRARQPHRRGHRPPAPVLDRRAGHPPRPPPRLRRRPDPPGAGPAGGPPIIVSGRQPVAMRRAARAGDGWMPYLYSPERYAESVATIRTEAERLGRDLSGFEWFAYVFVSLDDDPARARRAALDFFGGTYRDDYDRVPRPGRVRRRRRPR